MVSTPSAPSASETAQAQAEYNQDTAVTQQLLNMTNQVTPYGNVTYNQTGTGSYVGPDGKTYTVPRFTQTTTLNPEQQSTLNQTQAAANNIAGTAESLSGDGLSGLTQAVDTSGAPALQSSYGSDFGQQYNNTQQAVLNQMMPTLDRNAAQSRAQMIASGIRPGTAAYTANEQSIGTNYNNAASQATLDAQSVENQLVNQNAQAATFNNDARNQYLSQYYQQRDEPLNELSALLSGSQVTNANTATSSTPQTQVGGVDYSGLVEQNYEQQMQQSNQMMSGIFSVASSAAGMGGMALGSDRRINTDIHKLFTLPNGLNVYRFRYKKDPAQVHVGFMAQEVREHYPEAISHSPDGFMMVDYDAVGRYLDAEMGRERAA